MKFGKTECPEQIDFTLPEDDADTARRPLGERQTSSARVYVGCAKWNRAELRNFYPPKTKDELAYYSTQFNAIELNATFYRIFPASVFSGWRDKTPHEFMFFPKIPQLISHRRRLKETHSYVDEFLSNASYLDNKLGMVFLQMAENFGPKNAENVARLQQFIQGWPRQVPLAVELRHTDWFNTADFSAVLYALFEEYQITNIITDTAARRDLLHMRLTTPRAFIRFVGANHKSDYSRLDDWVNRLAHWLDQGLQEVAFFVHQNHELESPLLAAYFIKQLNQRLSCDLVVPQVATASQASLF